MKTEFEISSVISNYVTSNEGVTDFPVSLKQISDEVDTLRMRSIEDLEEKGKLRQPFLNFTQVIEFDGSTPALSVKKNTLTNVRYIDIPRLFMMSNNKPAISYVGGLAGTQHFRVVSGLQREWFKKDRWIGRLPTAVVIELEGIDGFRIEFHNISPNKARIVGIFEDPSDLEPFGYNGSLSLYPLPSGPVDIIIGKTVESYLRTMYRLPIQSNQQVDAPKQVRETT